MTTKKCSASKEQLSKDTERAYYWLAKNYPRTGGRRARGKALETLRLRILKQSSFDEIADELGGSIGEHSARCAWAREMHKHAKPYKLRAYPQRRANVTLEQPHVSRLQNRAHAAVAKAIRRGELLSPEYHLCAHSCDKIAQEYHHDDYTRPLDVTPLCKPCHYKLHAELRRKKR